MKTRLFPCLLLSLILAAPAFAFDLEGHRGTRGLAVPKTNWANTIDQGPFEAYAVTCGLTFTFGGLKISNEGEVENTDGHAIPGLFAAGELVGGLFYHNYPGGTGLVSGAVLGKLAGDGAGKYVAGKN